MTTRRICFTYFVDDDSLPELDQAIETIRNGAHFRGMCYQLERTPSTAREHLQGYVEYDKPRRISTLREEYPAGTHIEVARGNRASNIAYCTKSESRVEGPWCDEVLQSKKMGDQGSRSDLRRVGECILSGATSKADLAVEFPEMVLRYPRGISELYQLTSLRNKQCRRPTIQVEVIYGIAGCGKTRYATRDLASTFILDGSNSDTLWFDGYDNEPTLVLDDFYGWIRHGTLLRLLDIYPFRCPIKGGHVYASWTKVYITSNRHPSTWYDKFPWNEDLALQRRIHRIWSVSETMFGTIWTCEKTGVCMSFNQDGEQIN